MKVYTGKDIIWKGKIYSPEDGIADVPKECNYKHLLKVKPPKKDK